MVTSTSPSYLQRIQSHLAADTWRKYCRFDVNIKQSINLSTMNSQFYSYNADMTVPTNERYTITKPKIPT